MGVYQQTPAKPRVITWIPVQLQLLHIRIFDVIMSIKNWVIGEICLFGFNNMPKAWKPSRLKLNSPRFPALHIKTERRICTSVS